jgi:hypothetical protein
MPLTRVDCQIAGSTIKAGGAGILQTEERIGEHEKHPRAAGETSRMTHHLRTCRLSPARATENSPRFQPWVSASATLLSSEGTAEAESPQMAYAARGGAQVGTSRVRSKAWRRAYRLCRPSGTRIFLPPTPNVEIETVGYSRTSLRDWDNGTDPVRRRGGAQ